MLIKSLLPPARTLAVASLAAGAVGLIATTPATAADKPAASTSQEGTLVEVVSDDFKNGRAAYAYGLQRKDRSFVSLDGLPSSEAKKLVGRQVRVKGKSVGASKLAVESVMAAEPTTTAPTTTTTATTAGTASTYHRVAVVLVNFADNPVQPVTPDQLRTTMFTGTQSVDAYYQDSSDGKVGVRGDVVGWHTVSRVSTATCDYAAWGNAARTAATNSGTDLTAYDSVMYFWPQQASCGWAGLAQLPGSEMWINGYNDLRVLSHELGHNLGEHHASAEKCTDAGLAITLPGSTGSCSVAEYGDPFTVMGSGATYLHSASARSHLGYLAPTTLTAGEAGTFTLAAADSTGTSGARLLRVPRGDGSFLALEYRQPTGVFDTFSLGLPVTTGVTIRRDWGTGTRQTTLVDTVPGTASYSDAPLLAGRSLTDPVSGATITVGLATTTSVSVEVSYGGGTTTTDTTAPSSVTDLLGSATTQPSTLLQWGAATDESGVSGYRVWRYGVHVGDTSARSFAESDVQGGQTYGYSVAAVDTWGNVGPKSSVSVTVPTGPVVDSTAPTAVGSLSAVLGKKGAVSVTWTPATDNIGVTTYTVTRSGGRRSTQSAQSTVTGTSYTDKPGRGTWTYTVVAKDAAGNTSAPVSVSITV